MNFRLKINLTTFQIFSAALWILINLSTAKATEMTVGRELMKKSGAPNSSTSNSTDQSKTPQQAQQNTNKKKLKYLQDAMIRATAEEKKDLVKLLESIEVTPLKQKYKGQPLFKVRFVEKGSVFDRAGIERGDIIANGSAPTPEVQAR